MDWNFLVPQELATSFQDAWKSRLPEKIPSELHLKLHRKDIKPILDIIKDIRNLSEDSTQEVFEKLRPLLAPDLDLRSPLVILFSERDHIRYLVDLMYVLKDKNFDIAALKQNDFNSLIRIFKFIDDEHIRITEDIICEKYLHIMMPDNDEESSEESDFENCEEYFKGLLRLVADQLSRDDYSVSYTHLTLPTKRIV